MDLKYMGCSKRIMLNLLEWTVNQGIDNANPKITPAVQKQYFGSTSKRYNMEDLDKSFLKTNESDIDELLQESMCSYHTKLTNNIGLSGKSILPLSVDSC